MIRCPICARLLPEDVRFCPDDGTPLMATTVSGPPTATESAAVPQPPLQLPAVVGGRFRLVERRGSGGMATVYRAIDTHLDREVAIKLIKQELRVEAKFDVRFQREARILSSL